MPKLVFFSLADNLVVLGDFFFNNTILLTLFAVSDCLLVSLMFILLFIINPNGSKNLFEFEIAGCCCWPIACFCFLKAENINFYYLLNYDKTLIIFLDHD